MVRNEAALLPSCLSSLENQVDAIYLTDTGSSDDSLAIAQSFGAHTRSFRWNDDFAAARNASLAGVVEDWILLLDADDLFPSGQAAKIRERLANDACAATLNYSVDSAFTPLRTIKLLRNGMDAHFEGIIHENLHRWLASKKAEGLRIQHLDVDLLHRGYNADSLPGKVARNLPLLQEEWERTTDEVLPERRLQIGAELGLALAYAGNLKEASSLLHDLLGKEINSGFKSPFSFQILINFLWVLLQSGDEAGRLKLMRSLEGLLAKSPVYQLHRGLVELAAAEFSTAREWLEYFHQRSNNQFEIPIPIEFLGAGLWRDLGICHAGEKDLSAAAECFQHCIELDPNNREYQLRLLACSR